MQAGAEKSGSTAAKTAPKHTIYRALGPDLKAIAMVAIPDNMRRVVGPCSALGVHSGRRRVVLHLLCDEGDAAVAGNHLEGLAEERVEGLAGAGGGAGVVADDEGCDEGGAVGGIGGGGRAVEEEAVLHVLRSPLQEAQRLVKPHRKADLAQVLADEGLEGGP